ncbi:hypothetical protein SAMN05216419_10665 [Nitrosomonas cryotolerans]|uniref:Zinc resistance-associated protein n=1 Tax=Nitrosomonas cryotolerans ATCC 49181 TaxID=1131553 RepID=A0A1N6JHB9_9PROT|nr:hypothetical protein [Nitrosomonas cryotolerans]SFQ11683.1 hypothetical protein SAMN05216419_10665 [Nitrosomonas cryotolerans]SIO43762.1 hypothetical protein SAMN02743940_2620 [Nitrosomonas cryotolerans ATCC 49181]
MKTGKYSKVLSVLVVLLAFAPMSLFASVQDNSNELDHDILAKQHENSARKMQAQIKEQEDILKNKPRGSYYGRTGQKIKSRVAHRIHQYEKIATAHQDKATYHYKMAAEQSNGQTSAQINGTKGRSDSHHGSL